MSTSVISGRRRRALGLAETLNQGTATDLHDLFSARLTGFDRQHGQRYLVQTAICRAILSDKRLLSDVVTLMQAAPEGRRHVSNFLMALQSAVLQDWQQHDGQPSPLASLYRRSVEESNARVRGAVRPLNPMDETAFVAPLRHFVVDRFKQLELQIRDTLVQTTEPARSVAATAIMHATLKRDRRLGKIGGKYQKVRVIGVGGGSGLALPDTFTVSVDNARNPSKAFGGKSNFTVTTTTIGNLTPDATDSTFTTSPLRVILDQQELHPEDGRQWIYLDDAQRAALHAAAIEHASALQTVTVIGNAKDNICDALRYASPDEVVWVDLSFVAMYMTKPELTEFTDEIRAFADEREAPVYLAVTDYKEFLLDEWQTKLRVDDPDIPARPGRMLVLSYEKGDEPTVEHVANGGLYGDWLQYLSESSAVELTDRESATIVSFTDLQTVAPDHYVKGGLAVPIDTRTSTSELVGATR